MSESSIERDSFTVPCCHAEPLSVCNLHILTQPSQTILGSLEEPCRTGGLVPGMREIKGAMLGRLPYYLVW